VPVLTHEGLVNRQPLVAGAMGARRFKLPPNLSGADSDSENEAAGMKRGRSSSEHAGQCHDASTSARSDLDCGLLLWQWMADGLSS